MTRHPRRAAPLALVLAALVALATWPAYGQVPPGVTSQRFFPETGFSIANEAFFDYFQRRGGLRTFGYPTSRELSLEGFRVQFFQRQVMQLRPDGQVQLINLLDPSVLPYTRANGSTFPAVDPTLVAAAPTPADPQYGERAVTFVRERAPDTFNTRPVNFGNTALSLVRAEDAFPLGEGPIGLVPLINVLEISGLPTSPPAADPSNANFIYQRFQRLILQYDATTNTTQALLLADYLKALLTGQSLPADLEAQARDSKYYRQYDRRRPNHLARPQALPGTDLTNAFEREDRPLPAVDFAPTVSIEVRPGAPALGATFAVNVVASDDNGVSRVSWNADRSGVAELDQMHEADCGGATQCTRSWNVVSRVPGTINLRARARDTAGQDSEEARGTVTVANTIEGLLERPAPNVRVGGTIAVTGWVVDRSANAGTGIQAVHLYLDGEQGQGFFLGTAEYGLPREDVARRLQDDRFLRSGFSFVWDTTRVSQGEHTLNVYALSAATGRWERFTTKFNVVARPHTEDPFIRLIEPVENTTQSGTTANIKGWAVDRNAPTGTGVAGVEVWLGGERNTPGAVKLGDALYGQPYGSPAEELGDERFRASGFLVVWNPSQFRPGDQVLYIYARSSYTDSESVRRVPIAIR